MQYVKGVIKKAIGKRLSPLDIAVVVNSYGRSGSTMLLDSIKRSSVPNSSRLRYELIRRGVSIHAWTLDSIKLKKGFYYKTHDYPPENAFDDHVRMIYVFSNPIDVIMSLWQIYKSGGEKWIQQHYEHMKVPYGNFENILSEDQLNLEKHFDAWLAEDRYSIAFVRYDQLWSHQEDISNYFGFQVKLPSYRERNAIAVPDKGVIRQLEKTYGALNRKINDVPSFFLNTEYVVKDVD